MDFSIHWVEQTASTQDDVLGFLSERELEEGYVLASRGQLYGKGQAGNKWESQYGKNLTFSFLLRPDFLPVEQQFCLQQSLSLALVDFVSLYMEDNLWIKWSNDIYIGKEKLCGCLIQNRISGNRYEAAICGIGLNVNQRIFQFAPNPTSLSLQTDKEYDLEILLKQLLDKINLRFAQLKQGDIETIHREYSDKLLYRGVLAEYIYKGTHLCARIEDVNTYGHLILTTKQGEKITAALKELIYTHNTF